MAVSIRERAPLGLSIMVTTPQGKLYRWCADDPNARNAPSGLTFSSAMPGGFESWSCSLQRDPSQSFPDLQELSKIQVVGAGGQVAWEGRIESMPDDAGDQFSVSPAGVGYQSHLDDEQAARALLVDRNINNWLGPGVGRQITALAAGRSVSGPNVGPDLAPSSQPLPSLITEIDGDWATLQQACEAWYDSRGVDIDKVYAAWNANVPPGTSLDPTNYFPEMGLGVNDSDEPAHLTGAIGGTPGTYTHSAGAGLTHAMLRLINGYTAGGIAGANVQVFWNVVAVYGATGLPLSGSFSSTDAKGVLASDGIPYLISLFAPLIGVTADSIQPSSFTIPQAVWLDSTKLSDMIKELAKYELLDWAVWEGPTFFLNPRGARGRRWRARSGQANLQEAGPQISRLWNGVIVSWNDVSGITRTVGPPGAASDYHDSALVDADPLNPVNQIAGLKRWAYVQMGSSTLAAATQIGSIFLQEQKKLTSAGQASLVGHVQDESGIFWPAWMVRAGDSIAFVDASDFGYRRVVHSAYDDSSKTCTIQLDQPPDSLPALLERLNIVLAPFGM